jgi:hypothetical protein
MESADFESILNVLVEERVDFVLVGALSAVLQGAPIMTFDVDIVHSRATDNVERLLRALDRLDARYRQKQEIKPTAEYLQGRGHQLLVTRFGPLDVLGHIEDDLEYEDLIECSNVVAIGEFEVAALSPAKYLELKRASSRPKDIAMVPVLAALVED